MIKTLAITNLTVFARATLRLSPSLNVIVGENGAGKTHLLKLAYAIVSANSEDKRRLGSPTKSWLQVRLAEKLINIFRPESLGRLARRRRGRERCDISVRFRDSALNMEFSFATNSKSEVAISEMPADWIDVAAAYIPTRELLTIYPNFVSVYEGHYLELEETWRDTCVLLGAPLQRGPKEARVRELLTPLEEAMGGTIQLDKNGRFYLSNASGRMEMPLVAEGVRKLAMIARLIATGALLGKGYLFWDEPEANLNPRLIKSVAQTIVDLSATGIQVFIATHSLFLLREVEIILASGRYSGLRPAFLVFILARKGSGFLRVAT